MPETKFSLRLVSEQCEIAGRRRHLVGPATAVIVMTLSAIFTAVVRAEDSPDTVVVRGAQTGAKITLAGIVEDYTGTELLLRTNPNEPPRVFSARDIVEVQTPQLEAQTKGLKLLSQGKADAAILEFESALKKEERLWVRREIVAGLVRASLRRGDLATAGRRFQSLVKSDPTTRHFGLIPLAWTSDVDAGAARDEASAWLEGKSEAGRLIGASLLYSDSEWRDEARAELKRLARSGDSRIHALAQMQLWRDEAQEGTRSRQLTVQWQRRIDELPDDLRAGPNYLLGRAYAARHDDELAAATLLWLPLVDDHDHHLAGRACFEAALALEKIGQRDESRQLFQEVVDRYGDTKVAKQAQGALASSQNEP